MPKSRSKHVGIVGITAEGAALCYRTVIAESVARLGEHKHPEISLHNASFDQILSAQQQRDHQQVARFILGSIHHLQQSGAEFAVIPANSVHYAIEQVQQQSPIPVLSIVDVTVKECLKGQYKKVAILGVGITMSDGLYEKPLRAAEITPLLPPPEQQQLLNELIYGQLVKGIFLPETKTSIIKVIKALKDQGAEAVIFGCTELPLIMTPQDSPLPYLDSTRLLAIAAVDYALA